jgi:hypothetical protein
MIRNLVFLAPLSAMRKRTRLAKMARYLDNRGIALKFLGWERSKGELARLAWDGELVEESSILSGGGYATRTARLMYPLWMAIVFFRCFTLPRGTVVWCLGWETAFPARIAGAMRRLTIIFDDADRFSMLIRLPGPLQRTLVRLEHWTSRRCALHLVPGWSRYEWRHSRMKLLRNSPLRADYEHAQAAPRNQQSKDISLYVNGWIAWDTGSRIVIEALEILKNRGIRCRLIVAGRVASNDGEALISRPETDFKGEIPQRKALELYQSCDLALTLYDPSVPINRHAESNKWGDCVFLGTPFVVNSEVETAAKFVSAGAAFSFRYNEPAALADIIEGVVRDPLMLDRARESLGRFQDEYQPFEEQLDAIFSDIMRTASADSSKDLSILP